MKKYYALFLLLVLFNSCDSSTYEEIQQNAIIEGNITYQAHVKIIIDQNCVSCHVVGGTAFYRPLTTYSQVKAAFQETDLINRIQKQNGELGIMPQTGRMPQDKINILLQWEANGLLEN